MTKKQLLSILGVAIVQLLLVVLAPSRRTWKGASGGAGAALLGDFPVNDVTALEIVGKEGTLKLENYLPAYNQFMLGQHGTQCICAKPACGNGASQNVGVQHDLHETSRNTSSSLR